MFPQVGAGVSASFDSPTAAMSPPTMAQADFVAIPSPCENRHNPSATPRCKKKRFSSSAGLDDVGAVDPAQRRC